MNGYLKPVELGKASRLIHHGPTVLVSAHHQGVDDVMAVGWACALDFAPPKVTVVLDKVARTRELVEGSAIFVVQVPTVAQLQLVDAVGTSTLFNDPDKLLKSDVHLFHQDGFGHLPFVTGCSAWLACKLIPEPHNQENYDLFIGEIVGAWADTRVFREGHWHFQDADPAWRSLHYIAGGHYYATGDSFFAATVES
ncbi:flavin reductase family protein [Paraburkholderia tuberum]|uniref:NADH-FMN oxidoreductase RutF, flavin reductase (DIM6/NTAB) family n=1 Tax=Paraburkholderia tuberum TaxID=157910 RepID=A0A1H1KHU4_9BURK|nr:flavin reductase family protein [Paraburkholderia tuberum]SDR61617.1 NADH-FMN oxidoreductase RutF, flavin reductase (DIM6/NTAB) family [Paraburkholderia tuberum]